MQRSFKTVRRNYSKDFNGLHVNTLFLCRYEQNTFQDLDYGVVV